MAEKNLFVVPPIASPGDGQVPLAMLVDHLDAGRLQVPHFQRGFVWNKEKIRGWIRTIIARNAIGCIVTYQIVGENAENSGLIYLADGFQRLTATKRFLSTPGEYAPGVGTNQARVYCEMFMATQQHRHYSSHDDALIAFQDLNAGTTPTPAEFHKGELTRTETGQFLWNNVPPMVEKVGHALCSKKTTRITSGKLLRDSLALYLQYHSGTKKKTFWKVSSSKPSRQNRSLERELADYINGQSIEELQRGLSQLQTFLEGQTALIQEILNDLDMRGRALSPTLFRWMLHTAIWRKNTGRSVALQKTLFEKIFEELQNHRSLGSRINLDVNGVIHSITLKLDSLAELKRLSSHYNVPLYQQPRRRQSTTAPGYDCSHQRPFAEFGEGETFFEPAPLNRARGAEEVQRGK